MERELFGNPFISAFDSIVSVPIGDIILDWPLVDSIIPRIADDKNATFTRASKAIWEDSSGTLQLAAVDEARFESAGFLQEPQRTNKCENYNVIGADQLGSEISSGILTKGKRYEITAHDDLDFTTAGAADNNVGTQFTATAALTLDAGDKVKEIGGTDLGDSSFVSGLGTETKAYHDGAWQNPIPGMTLLGDISAILSIVEDVAELANAGLDKIITSNKVYKVDNSGGSSNSFLFINGPPINTNGHIYTVYARRSAGTGEYSRVADTSNIDQENGRITSSSYSRRYYTEDPADASTNGRLMITTRQTDVIYFTLNQLEEGSIATSPIITDTTSGGVTRAVDDLKLPVADGINFSQEEGMLFCDTTPGFTGNQSSQQGLITLANSAQGLLLFGTGDGVFVTNDNTSTSTIDSGSWIIDSINKCYVRWKTGGELQIGVDGSSDISPASYDGDFDLSTYYRIGFGATEAFHIKNIRVLSIDHGQAFGESETL